MKREQQAIGVDLGGTNLRWAVVDGAGERLYQGRVPRPREAEEIVSAIRAGVADCRERYPEAVAANNFWDPVSRLQRLSPPSPKV